MAKNCTTIDDAIDRIYELMDEASSMQNEDPKARTIALQLFLLTGFHELAEDTLAKLYPEIIDNIKEIADEYGVSALIGDPSKSFNDKVEIGRVLYEAEEKLRNLDKYLETITRKGLVKRINLKGWFGDNGAAASYFSRSAKKGFSTANLGEDEMAIPGFIDIFLTARHKGKLVRLEDIAGNVREAKLLLLDKVVRHLQDRGLFNVDISHGETILFDKNGFYTGALEPEVSPVYSEIQKTFDPSKMAGSTHLDSLYQGYKKGNLKAKEELEAYNAWILLNNFDSVLTMELEDVVSITHPEEFGKIGNTSYKANIEKATQMWSFGFGDDVENVSDLVSIVTQELVESSKRYSWRGLAIDDAYISFKDYNYIIGEIKKLAISLQSHDIVLDLDDSVFNDETLEFESSLSNLSETTKSVLRSIEKINKENGELDFNGKPTLGQLIAFLSENPIRHLHAIFDVLCNTRLIDDGILNFEPLEKNLIWSMYKEIFGQDGPNSRSLFDLHHNTLGDEIFPILTQIADSMFAEEIILYYEDENGIMYALLLKDYAVLLLRNDLATDILAHNGYFTSRNLDNFLSPEDAEYAKKTRKTKSFILAYDVKVHKSAAKEISRRRGWKGKSVQLINNIVIPLKLNGEQVGTITTNADGTRVQVVPNKMQELWESYEFKKLIKDAIGIDFDTEVDLLAAYLSTFPAKDGINYVGLLDDIGKIVGTAVFNLAFNNELVPDILKNVVELPRTQSNIKVLIDSQFTKNTPTLDPKTGLVPVIPLKSRPTLLGNLSQAKAIANNVFGSALVKTGEGTSLANHCLSRLRNSYAYQLVTLNRNRWSASNSMSFVRNRNGLITGVHSSRELKSRSLVKTATDMSGVETWSLNFYNDWVAAFIPEKHRSNSPTGEGAACFIPSVNSDKGLFDRLACNLYAESHILAEGSTPENPIYKKYIDLTDAEIEQELSIEFGTFYKNVITNIIKENDRLLQVLGVNYTHRTDNPAQAWKEQLLAISDHFVYPEIIKTITDPLVVLYIQQHPGLDLENDQTVRNYITKLFVLNSGKTYLELIKKYKTAEAVADAAYDKLYGSFYKKITKGIHEAVTNYNKTHVRNPIQLAQHIHYTKGTRGLAVNNVLVALWGRFGVNPETEYNLIEEAGIRNLYNRKDLDTDIRLLLGDSYAGTVESLTPEQRILIAQTDSALDSEITKALYDRSLYTVSGYFKARDLEVTLKLLKDGCKIYLSGNKARNLAETDFLLSLDALGSSRGPWVTKEGTMAFTRVLDETTGAMIPTNDVELINNARLKGLPIEINPMISKLNRMDYLTTQLYICCVGGAHYVYKGGAGANVLEEEANRWLASNKRNVCYASTVHKFQNKVLNGAPYTYNYAIIEDIDAALYNIMGELKSHTPIDGGMLCNSFLPDLENKSLGGEAAGTDKKHFATFYFELYGAGGITKTAGFAATNERMRNSEDWRVLLQNMSNRKWIKEFSGIDGDIVEELDITKDYDGNDINWQDKNVFYYRELEDGSIKLYRLAKVEKTANPNEYNIYEVEINLYGQDISDILLRETEVIDTNWILFNDVFGGYRSVSMPVDHYGEEIPGSVLEPSEHSRKLMVEAINKVGYRKIKSNSYTAINKYGDVIEAYELEKTKLDGHLDDQDDVWQPLKYSDVHFAPNIGAIKSTQMNVNPSEAMSQLMDLNIMPIKMAQLGIQLDKEHHADQSELSMPTLIITACANKGFTLSRTTELYEALSNLTEIAIEDCMDGIMDLLPEGEHRGLLLAKIAEIIVDKLIYSKDDNEALNAVMQHLVEKRKEGKMLTPEEVKGNVPYSDSMVYSKIYSDLANHLTTKAIKLKISGSLAVICPTHHLERLYGNKRLSSLIELVPGGKGEAAALRAYQERIRNNGNLSELIYDSTRDIDKSTEELLNQASKIDTQHVYNIEYIDPLTREIKIKTITVNYPLQYWQIKEELTKFKITSVEKLKGALASTSADGIISIVPASAMTIEDFYNHIQGNHNDASGNPSLASLQKVEVFKILESQGYTLEELHLLIGDDVNKARMFILFHEISHKLNNDASVYPRNAEGKIDLLNPLAYAIEARATIDAWEKMREIVSNGENAQAYIDEVTEVNGIYENVMQGRELSAYNVRFSSDSTIEDGKLREKREFCIYDLDSLRLLYEVVNDVMPTNVPDALAIKLFGKNRLATLDGIYEYIESEKLLQTLKPNIGRIVRNLLRRNYSDIWEYFQTLDSEYRRLQKAAKADPSNRELAQLRNEAYLRKIGFLKSDFKFENSKATPAEAFINSYKNAIKIALRQAVQRDLFSLSSDFNGDRVIMSQGKLYEINPNSIESIAYELIMPKVYKTVFGLKEHDDLLAILADLDFFAKRAMSKLKNSLADDSLYDYLLKRFSGDHMYILDSRKGIPEVLRDRPGFVPFPELDGTYSYVDINGDVIFPLSSNSDKVMITADGTEVIVTDNPQFYIENNIFNTATFSNSRVRAEELQELVTNLKNSTSKSGLKFHKLFANRKGQLKAFSDLKKRNTAFDELTENADTNTSSDELNEIISEIYAEGKRVHASFSKSLDIIAGRVPAQSQLSFMTQRVVAFGDADINSAYVSTFLLFILGSDLDIDTVNLIGPGFDKNGHYVMWSSFANIGSEELIKASETLPFPTGKSTEITYDNSKDSFFVTYDKYFGENNLFSYERDADTGEIVLDDEGIPEIGINTESPEILIKLGEFLREVKKNGLNLKGTIGEDGNWHYSNELDAEIYELGLKFNDYKVFNYFKIKPTQLFKFLNKILSIVDQHNLYVKHVGKDVKELMAKNLAYYQMYSVAADPANQTEAQESIDGPTSLIKGKGGAVEVAMTEEDKTDITSNNEKLSGPDPATKAYSLATGQIGKQGVSIGAKGTLGNSVILFAIDYILNSDMDDRVKERILLPVYKDGKGKTKTKKIKVNGQEIEVLERGYWINGKLRSAIANIYDKSSEKSGISLQTSLDILGMLDSLLDYNEIPLNAATSIAAMLSVAVDFCQY